MESKEARIARFENGSPVEAIETLLNSIGNFFNNEISIAPDNYQTSLLFLGIHAAALTISEVFFNKTGLKGYKLFLEKYVDQKQTDKQFSLIAEDIHNWRNVLAHQWLGLIGHQIGYDYKMIEGWKKSPENILYINPKIYCDAYLVAFSSSGKIWKYEEEFHPDDLERIKSRIIQKYINS